MVEELGEFKNTPWQRLGFRRGHSIRVQTIAQFGFLLFGTIAPARFYLCSKLVEESFRNVSLKSSQVIQ